MTRRLGLVADAAGNYGDVSGRLFQVDPITGVGGFFPYRGNSSQHTFLFGPELRVSPDGRRWAVNLRVMGGFARTSDLSVDTSTATLSAQRLRLALAQNVAAASAGGSFDFRINDRISYRVAQPEALFTRIGGSMYYNFRVSTGLVFRFGGR